MQKQQPRIVVTGAASGIGLETARTLRALGTEVIGVDRAPLPDSDMLFVQADLASANGVAEAVHAIGELTDGHISGLANVAGVPGTVPWVTVQRVNVFGLRDLTQGLVPMIDHGGSIVNLASAVAHDWRERAHILAEFCAHPAASAALEMVTAVPDIRDHSYLFSKQCVRYLTQEQAARLIRHGIRVNSVSPGPVETPILEEFKNDHGRDKVEGARDAVGRFGTPADIAQVVALLLGESMRWVNGTDIRVDGGLTAIRASVELGAVK